MRGKGLCSTGILVLSSSETLSCRQLFQATGLTQPLRTCNWSRSNARAASRWSCCCLPLFETCLRTMHHALTLFFPACKPANQLFKLHSRFAIDGLFTGRKHSNLIGTLSKSCARRVVGLLRTYSTLCMRPGWGRTGK